MFKNIFERYNNKIEEVSLLPNSIFYKVITGVIAFLLSLLIVVGPITLLVNMYMFYDFIPFVFIGIAFFTFLLVFLFRVFYIQGLCKGLVKSLKDIYIVEAVFIFLFILIFLIYILFFL